MGKPSGTKKVKTGGPKEAELTRLLSEARAQVFNFNDLASRSDYDAALRGVASLLGLGTSRGSAELDDLAENALELSKLLVDAATEAARIEKAAQDGRTPKKARSK